MADLLGCYILIALFTNLGFVEGATELRSAGSLGKVISLAAILNLIAFFALLKFKKELMARGVVLATLVLTLVALFA